MGKILGNRYVVLEEFSPAEGEEGGARFLAYDMTSLARVTLRVGRGEDGELSPELYELEGDGSGQAQKSKPAARPAARLTVQPEPDPARELAPKPKPRPKAKLKPAPKPRLAAEPVHELTPKPKPRPKLQHKPRPTPLPKLTPTPTSLPRLELKPTPRSRPKLELTPTPRPRPKLELTPMPTPRADEDGQTRDPNNSTQPLNLTELQEVERALRVEPSGPQNKGRPETRRIEAAWFAMGDELAEEEAPPPAEEYADPDPAQLWDQASALSRDEYRHYSLDLSPPVPPAATKPPVATKPPAAEEPPPGPPVTATAGEITTDDLTEAAAGAVSTADEEAPVVIEPSLDGGLTASAPAPAPDSTRLIQQEIGVASPAVRLRQELQKAAQSRPVRWSISTRRGTFLLGLILGVVLTLLTTC